MGVLVGDLYRWQNAGLNRIDVTGRTFYALRLDLEYRTERLGGPGFGGQFEFEIKERSVF